MFWGLIVFNEFFILFMIIKGEVLFIVLLLCICKVVLFFFGIVEFELVWSFGFRLVNVEDIVVMGCDLVCFLKLIEDMVFVKLVFFCVLYLIIIILLSVLLFFFNWMLKDIWLLFILIFLLR